MPNIKGVVDVIYTILPQQVFPAARRDVYIHGSTFDRLKRNNFDWKITRSRLLIYMHIDFVRPKLYPIEWRE